MNLFCASERYFREKESEDLPRISASIGFGWWTRIFTLTEVVCVRSFQRVFVDDTYVSPSSFASLHFNIILASLPPLNGPYKLFELPRRTLFSKMLSRTALRTCLRVPAPIAPIINRSYAAAANAQPKTPSPQEIKEAAAQGVRLTPEQVAEISRREQAARADNRRVHGGPASTAQSILSKQEQLEDKMDELSEKSLDEISEKDVGQLQSALTKGRGGKQVDKDSIVSDLHRIAQTNEGLRSGSVPLGEMTKEEAAELQSEEARMTGTGKTEAGGVAATAQSMADRKGT